MAPMRLIWRSVRGGMNSPGCGSRSADRRPMPGNRLSSAINRSTGAGYADARATGPDVALAFAPAPPVPVPDGSLASLINRTLAVAAVTQPRLPSI